jgi:hypothetical protein
MLILLIKYNKLAKTEYLSGQIISCLINVLSLPYTLKSP